MKAHFERPRQIEAPGDQSERIAASGGRLLSSAFSFLADLLPQHPENADTERVSQSIRLQLDACLDKEAGGQVELTATVPDASAVENLANSLARLMFSVQRNVGNTA